MARAQKKMVGVGEDDSGVKISQQLARSKALNRALRSDWHENGGFDRAVSSVEQARASASLRTGGLNLKSQGGHAILLWGTEVDTCATDRR